MDQENSLLTARATVGVRILSYLLDFTVGHAVANFLLSYPSIRAFEAVIAQITSFIDLALGVPERTFSYLVLIYLITGLVRFLWVVLFGRTFGQWLGGIATAGPWWWQRMAGGSRTIVDLLTTPMIYPDFPLVRGRFSFKERFTGAYLVKKGRSKEWLLILILPFFIGLSCFSPFLIELSFLDAKVVTFEKFEKKGLEKGADFSQFQSLESEKFHLKTFTSLENGRFGLFPDYEFVKRKKKRLLSPYLLIYDHQSKTIGELKLRANIELSELLKRGQISNPLFKSSFPHLNQFLSEKKKLEFIKLSPGDAPKGHYSQQIQEEIVELVRHSFELSAGSGLGEALKHGPFLRGFIEVKRAFLTLARPGIDPEVDIMVLGDVHFLRFRQVFDDNSPHDKKVVHTYIPLSGHHSFSLELGWDKSLPGAISSRDFKKVFFKNSQWYLDSEGFSTPPSKESEVNAFNALDLINEADKKVVTRELLEGYLYSYYYQNCRSAIQSRDSTLQSVLKYNILRLSTVINRDKENTPLEFSPLFKSQWRELTNSFELQDEAYFNLQDSGS